LAIECKSLKGKYQYFEKEEIAQLKTYARLFGAEPWFALRFDRDKWYFLRPEDLKETENLFTASIDTAKEKGRSFEAFISL
jgi:Holliday junction resolvase